MSIKSQTNNMRRLAVLLNFNLCNIHGKKECGPNGSKQVFLNVGKVFLRALARDLGLHDVTVSSNAGGIGVSGECSLIGMWENGGLYVSISQPACGSGMMKSSIARNTVMISGRPIAITMPQAGLPAMRSSRVRFSWHPRMN